MNTRKLTLTALLTAIALCIFTAEAQLPSLTAIPGIKLGLANVVTVFAMYALGPGATLCIVLVRVTLGCIATGQMMAFLFSMTGGLLAFCVSALLRRWFAPEQMWVVSVFAAVAHNLGQLAVAMAVMGTTAIGYYLPVLLISGIITAAASIGGYAYIVEISPTLGSLWQMLMGMALVPLENVWPTILTYSLVAGALVGGLGSMFSIRKHLNV